MRAAAAGAGTTASMNVSAMTVIRDTRNRVIPISPFWFRQHILECCHRYLFCWMHETRIGLQAVQARLALHISFCIFMYPYASLFGSPQFEGPTTGRNAG